MPRRRARNVTSRGGLVSVRCPFRPELDSAGATLGADSLYRQPLAQS